MTPPAAGTPPGTGRGSRARRRGILLLRVAVSAALLALLARAPGMGEVAGRLAGLRPGWVAAGLALSAVHFVAAAWRWRFTAGRLGMRLGWGEALREYYLAAFLNQALPGGVLGDVSRAWRHARARGRADAPGGPAVRAVILERASGQGVMVLAAVASFLALPVATSLRARLLAVGLAALCGGVGAAVGLAAARGRRPDSLGARVWRETRAALFGRDALPLQLASSAVAVGSLLAMYVVAARTVGVSLPVGTLLPLVAPVLLTMLVPVTVAGWGLREGAAALLWGAVGLTAADGVAVSVAYGLLALVGSLPGALVLAAGPGAS